MQLGALTLLTRLVGLHYLMATALAVATTVVHNFAWHERFTFYDRVRHSRRLRAVARRFFKFNLLTGVISIGGNVLVMHWLRGYARLPLVAANLVAIGICGGFNYLANERLVFRNEFTTETRRRGVAAVLLFCAVAAAPSANAQQITIQLLNPKNGRPTSRVNLGIEDFERRFSYGLESDHSGKVTWTVPPNTAEIGVGIPESLGCRRVKSEVLKASTERYSMTEILTTGVVATNQCSKRTAAPVPGQLILFARPVPLWARLLHPFVQE